ncbi:hypothetical protein [Nannocystis sp. SCPEA4]|uniref:tetratricopeptide repeat protein n=1 Tax=Nannocystis sp. SCPEA4 TaxID=2996787 RepID=UPI0022704D78|nr:hypothetical protein [Nannocystis sp. SCPEA4]MCY1061102.1 hypothetical protein [Nannocystis sp. SCPEA4]
MRRLALVFVLATACKGHSAGTAGPGDRSQAAARRSDPELAAVADRIDPGPQRPIYEILPQWLKAKADADGDPKSPKALAEAREAIAGWDKVQSSDRTALLIAAHRLGRGLVLAERAVVAGSNDPELLAALAKAYRAVHGLKFFRDNQTFRQMVSSGLDLALKEENSTLRQLDELRIAVSAAIDRAPALHMHVAARLLREHPGHPTVPETLATVSHAAMEAEDHDTGVQALELAVARKGDRATGLDFVELARVCYVGLDLACGDLALKTAEKRGAPTPAEAAEFASQLRTVDRKAETARKIVALAGSDGLEAQVERGHLLLQLNHRKAAEATFTAARAAHPKDARPLTGLAATALQLGPDYVTAAGHLRAARELENRDRRYYEVALGTLPLVVLHDLTNALTQGPTPNLVILDAPLAELRQLIDGFRAFDPARAAVLELLLTIGREATPKLLGGMVEPGMAMVRKLPERALALTRQFPESRDAWLLVFASVRLTADAKRARIQATTPLPAALKDDPAIRLQQARALLDLAFMWEDRALLAEAVKAAASLPAGVDADVAADIRATLDAVQGRQGDRAASKRAAAAFARLATRKTGKERALALNNQAMALAQTGDVKQAIELLTQAQMTENAPAASCNTFALAFDRLHEDGASHLMLAQVVREADTPAIRMHAQAWRVAIADAGNGDAKAMREKFAAVVAEERGREFLGTVLFGRWGVALQLEFKLSIGYNATEGLVMLDEVPSRWWQFIPAPTFDALLAAKAKAKPAGR